MAAKLKLKFDLVEIIKSITTDRRKLEVYLPLVADSDFKREFGKRMIDDIEARLDEGKDKDNREFRNNEGKTGYSDAYKKSEEFKFWGKNNTVNLQLTGQMRSAIDVIRTEPRAVVIGFIDQEANDKAHGHIHGANNLPVRDFWGVPKANQKEIMKEMIAEFSGREITTFDIPEVTAEADFGFEVDLTDGE